MTRVTFEVPTKSASLVETIYELGGMEEIVYNFPPGDWKMVQVDLPDEED